MDSARFCKSLLTLEDDFRARMRRGEGGFIFYASPKKNVSVDMRLILESKCLMLNNVVYDSEDDLLLFLDVLDRVQVDFGLCLRMSNPSQIPKEVYLTRVCSCSGDPLWRVSNEHLSDYYTCVVSRMCKPPCPSRAELFV